MDDKNEGSVLNKPPHRRPSVSGIQYSSEPEVEPKIAQLVLKHISLQAFKELGIPHQIDPKDPGLAIISSAVTDEELVALQERTTHLRKGGSGGTTQTPPRRPASPEHDDEVEVVKYDPPRDGIIGITKIPKSLTRSHVLDSLGWRNAEVKDGFFEIQFPLGKLQIDQILKYSKTSELADDGIRVYEGSLEPLLLGRALKYQYVHGINYEIETTKYDVPVLGNQGVTKLPPAISISVLDQLGYPHEFEHEMITIPRPLTRDQIIEILTKTEKYNGNLRPHSFIEFRIKLEASSPPRAYVEDIEDEVVVTLDDEGPETPIYSRPRRGVLENARPGLATDNANANDDRDERLRRKVYYADDSYSPPRRTVSPEALEYRSPRRRHYRDRQSAARRGSSLYDSRSRSRSRSHRRYADYEPRHRRTTRSISPYFDDLDVERHTELEDRIPVRQYDPWTEDYSRRDGRYQPPEDEDGKVLKFDVNLLSLASDIEDNQTTKIPRPAKNLSTGQVEVSLIETSQRYTGDSGGETVVLTAGLKSSPRQPGHLQWIHLEDHHMSFESLKQLLRTEELDSDDALIAHQLLQKVQGDGGEKLLVHGYYLAPKVRRCDAHDVEKEAKPDRTCTFVCFPYFSYQNPPPVSSNSGVHTHSARGLVQMLYYLESTKARDLEQVVRKLRPTKGDEAIHVPQMWAIVLGSETLITYCAAPLSKMRGEKIQITKPITTIRTSPSTLRVTDPWERVFFFSLEQCKTWFELTSIIHDQCLQRDGYSIDECNLFLKNDVKLEAPSWVAAIEAGKHPIVDIFVRFKNADELAEAEIERSESERARQRYRADDSADESDSPARETLRLIRGRDSLGSHNYRKPAMRRESERMNRGQSTLDSFTDERRARMQVVRRRGSRFEPQDYPVRGPSSLVIPSRRQTNDSANMALVRAQSWTRSRRSDNGDIYKYRRQPVQIVRRVREPERIRVVRERVVRRHERDLSPVNDTTRRSEPRYQSRSVVVNDSKRIEKARTSGYDIYYVPEKERAQDIPAVQVTAEGDNESKPAPSQRQPLRLNVLRHQSSLRKPPVASVSEDEALGGTRPPSPPKDPSKEEEVPNLPEKRARSSSSTRLPPLVKPSVSPILMWPIGKANATTKSRNSDVKRATDGESASDSSIIDLLARINDHLVADQDFEHSRLFLETDQTTRQDPLFKSLEHEHASSQVPKPHNNVSSPAQPEILLGSAQENIPRGSTTRLNPSPPELVESELNKVIKEFHDISCELLDAFLPANYPTPIAGRYYGAMKKIIEMLNKSHSQYFLREGKNSLETKVYMIHDVRIDPEYIQYHKIKSPSKEFLTCDECSGNRVYVKKAEIMDHLRDVHFLPESGSSDKSSGTEMGHWIKSVDRLSAERCAAEQLRVLKRCRQHLLNLQTESREIRDGVSTNDKAHQARYRLPKALVEAFQRLVMLLIYTLHVFEVITNKSGRWNIYRWESEDDREYTEAYEHMIFLGTGAEVNMEYGKLDLLQMIRLEDYTQSVSCEAVGPEYILSMVMQNLQGGINCTDLVDIYKEWTERLAYQVSLRPRKRLLRDFQYLSEEIKVLCSTLADQDWVLENFRRCLVPSSFRITTETRVSMYTIEQVLLSQTSEMILKSFNDYKEIDRKVERMASQTKMSIEILDDDHGKAIFVFTVVTLIFLPLSFVSSLLGMNTVDIRNQDTTQWLFWAIALPITAAVVVLALVVAYRYDEIREWIDKKTKKELRE